MIITLTTDFGHKDGYPAIMKGVILSGASHANIIDFTHDIPAQDIAAAADLIGSNYQYFPKGSLHVIVVDPGVGSLRRIILLSANDHLFLAPDNGVLTQILQNKNLEQHAFLAERPDLYLKPLSATFHGRDIFAPLAAHLACGHSPESIGRKIAMAELRQIKLPEILISHERQEIQGCVTSIDHFGNIITNIKASDIDTLRLNLDKIILTITDKKIKGLCSYYAEAPPNKPLLIINSSGRLEIAVNHGNAAAFLGADLHDSVLISADKDQN